MRHSETFQHRLVSQEHLLTLLPIAALIECRHYTNHAMDVEVSRGVNSELQLFEVESARLWQCCYTMSIGPEADSYSQYKGLIRTLMLLMCARHLTVEALDRMSATSICL